MPGVSSTAWAEPALLSVVRPLGEVAPQPSAVPSQRGEVASQPTEALAVELFPFLVDGALVTVLAPAGQPLGASELIVKLGATTVRGLQAHEVLLGLQVGGWNARILIDERLQGHEALMVCVDPPSGYARFDLRELQSRLAGG